MHQQADSAFKPAQLESGLEVMVPQFIKTGDAIRVDAATMKYVDRARAKGAQTPVCSFRPALRLLSDKLRAGIVAEARNILATLGVEIHNREVVSLLADHGAPLGEDSRVRIPDGLVDRALGTVPHSFRLFDALGNQTHDFAGDKVYFTPGSAAINILDGATGEMRPPTTADYVRFVKLTSGLAHIASQSTALIPADVAGPISDSYRLYLSLLHGEKPVVTGAFTIEGFEVMRDLQLAVRGTAENLRARSPCASSPAAPPRP